jgi:hypothetical protein
MCVRAARALASESMSMSVLIVRKETVGPGRIIEVKKDMASLDRFSIGELGSSSGDLRMVSTV